MPSSDIEKTYHMPYELFPIGSFELPVVLQGVRELRASVVGADVAAKMDRATAELEAAEPLANVPGVGAVAPTFELLNQNGEMVSLKVLLSSDPTVVVFYRGVWCPFCNLTLRAYEQHVPEFQRLGASMVAISLQTPDDSLTTAERNTLTHHVLSDSNAAVSRAYGLVFELPEDIKDIYRGLGHPLPAFNGTGDWKLPIPATFVIDRDGRIQFADALPDYTHRTEPTRPRPWPRYGHS